jgi:hypothetical protein
MPRASLGSCVCVELWIRRDGEVKQDCSYGLLYFNETVYIVSLIGNEWFIGWNTDMHRYS